MQMGIHTARQASWRRRMGPRLREDDTVSSYCGARIEEPMLDNAKFPRLRSEIPWRGLEHFVLVPL